MAKADTYSTARHIRQLKAVISELSAAGEAVLKDVREAEAVGDPCCVGTPRSNALRAAIDKAERVYGQD